MLHNHYHRVVCPKIMKGMTMGPDSNDLCGWELNNPDPDIFDIQVVEVLGACRNCEQVG